MDFFEAIIPLFGIIFTFGIPGILIFWYLYIKHREKMRMIEKGLTPEEIKAYYKDFKNPRKPKNPYSALKWGILFLFVGMGLLVANIMYEFYDFDEGVGFGLVITFAGLGLLVYYGIISSKLKKIEDKDSSINQKIAG
jgi:hypothetical protein